MSEVIGGSLFAAGMILGKKMCDNAVTISVMEPDTAKVELELVKSKLVKSTRLNTTNGLTTNLSIIPHTYWSIADELLVVPCPVGGYAVPNINKIYATSHSLSAIFCPVL